MPPMTDREPCDCTDPVVFGHHHDRLQPHTYAAGETFTITGGELNYTIGGTNRTIPLAGAQIYWGPPEPPPDLQGATITDWNWAELPETIRYRARLTELG